MRYREENRVIRWSALCLLLTILTALPFAAFSEDQHERFASLTIAQLIGVRLDVGDPSITMTLPTSGLALGLGADLVAFGGNVSISQFPRSVARNLNVDARRRSDVSGLPSGNYYCYVITAFVDDDEFLQKCDFEELTGGSGGSWSVSFHWEVDERLRSLLKFGIRVGYKIYRVLISENTIGYIPDPSNPELELIKELVLKAGEAELSFVDANVTSIAKGPPALKQGGDLSVGNLGTIGALRVGQVAAPALGSAFIQKSLRVGSNLTVGNLATVDALCVGKMAAPTTGAASIQSNLLVGINAQISGNVGIGAASVPGARLSIAALPAAVSRANILLDAGNLPAPATGRVWELASTAAGDFELWDNSFAAALGPQLRWQVTGLQGNVSINMGHPTVPMLPASQGTLDVWERALPGGLRRLSIGQTSFLTIGSAGIPAGGGQPAVGASLGRFTINDDATLPGWLPRMRIDDDVRIQLGHNTIPPPPGGGPALAIPRKFGYLGVFDVLEWVNRLAINSTPGNSALVIGVSGLPVVPVPPTPAVPPQLGAFRIADTNVVDDRMQIKDKGTYFHIGNPDIFDPDFPLQVVIKEASGEFIITDELAGVNPRFMINAEGRVGIGVELPVDPLARKPAGTLEVAHSLGVGVAPPRGLGDLHVGNDAVITNSLGVGVVAPGGAGDGQFTGNVGIGGAPILPARLNIVEPLGANIYLDATPGGGSNWELISTPARDFEVSDRSAGWLRWQVTGPTGNMLFNLGTLAVGGTFTIEDLAAFPGGFRAGGNPRLEINAAGKVGIGSSPLGGPAGSLEVAHSLGVGMAAPAAARPGDVAIRNDVNVGGNLDVAGNVDILNNLTVTNNAAVLGNLRVTGLKFFVQPYPMDSTKVITYASLEGPEAGTYVRGTARLVDGEVTIELPESFRLVTSEDGITVQVTLLQECNGLYVVEKSTERIVVKELMSGSSNARFDYLVQGVRKGYEDFEPIRAGDRNES